MRETHQVSRLAIVGVVYGMLLTIGLGVVTVRSEIAITTAKTTALEVANEAKAEAARTARITANTECQILGDLIHNATVRIKVEGNTKFPAIEGPIRERRVAEATRAIATYKKVRRACQK